MTEPNGPDGSIDLGAQPRNDLTEAAVNRIVEALRGWDFDEEKIDRVRHVCFEELLMFFRHWRPQDPEMLARTKLWIYKVGAGMSSEATHEMIRSFSKFLPPDAMVLPMGPDQNLETFDDDQLAQAGLKRVGPPAASTVEQQREYLDAAKGG